MGGRSVTDGPHPGEYQRGGRRGDDPLLRAIRLRGVWEFETAGGETHNRYIVTDNGVELKLCDTDGETDFEPGTAWGHLAIGVDDVDRVFEEIDHHGSVRSEHYAQ